MVVKTIETTRTSSGLRVEAALDTGDYPVGVGISKQRFDALPLHRHAVHGTWNYTLQSRPASCATEAAPAASGSPADRRRAMLDRLADPRLTGMTSPELAQLAAAVAPLRPPAPNNATPNNARVEPGGPPAAHAANHCSTTPPAS